MIRTRGTEARRIPPPKLGRAIHRRGLAVVLVVCAAGPAVSCNKGPARAALAETDQALAVAGPELARYAPAELARITADADAARGQLAAGRYTDALRSAQMLPERIARASARASARRDQLTPAWTGIAASLPARIEALRARMAELDASRWPREFDPAAIEAAKAELRDLETAWAHAGLAFRAGDVREAVRLATDAQALAAALAARIASPSGPRAHALPSPGPRASAQAPDAPSAPDAPGPAPQPAPPAGDPVPPPATPPATTVPSGME